MERVGIIVLNYRGVDTTIACLRSLARLRYGNHEVVVVNNSPEDDMRTVAEEFPGTRVLQAGGNLGFTGGCRLGIASFADPPEYYLLLNNDTVVDPDFLEPLVERFRRGGKVGMAAPKIYFQGSDRIIWSCGGKVRRWSGRSVHFGVCGKDEGQYDRLDAVDWVSGCAVLVSRAMIGDVGMLDEEYFAYGEDLDWSLRARAKGYTLAVVPSSHVWHKGHASSIRSVQVYLLTRNHLRNLAKHRRAFACRAVPAFAYATAVIFGKAAALSLRGRWSQSGAMLRGVWDFLSGRFGQPPGMES